MKRLIVGTCIVLGLVVWASTWGSCLTTDRMTVFVNDSDFADGAECIWHGGQLFRVTFEEFVASIRILPAYSEPSPYTMSVVLQGGATNDPVIDSISFRLVYAHANGEDRELRLREEMPNPRIGRTEDGQFLAWHQSFRVTEDLAELPDGSVRLLWSMDFRDRNGKTKQLSITVPLRKEEIVIPSSIV